MDILFGRGSKTGVFITDITTIAGTVTNKVYEDDVVLLSCDSDATSITVSVLAFTGFSHLKPVVSVNSILIPSSNFVLDSDKRWAGSVLISVAGPGPYSIDAVHQDGGSFTTVMNKVVGPVVTALAFTGDYPGSQTELKAGDSFAISVSTDVPSDRVEIQDFESADYKLVSVTGSGPYTTTIVASNRGGGSIGNQRLKVRCRGVSGIWGAEAITLVSSGDKIGYVNLNNDYPVISAISQGDVDYPGVQLALKDSEIATVNHTITGADVFAYTSGGELSIANPTTYEPAKVVSRISGTYNVLSNNLLITATKSSNGAVSTRDALVYIAHTSPIIGISLPYSRLRSSPAGSSYIVTLTASQNLLNAPSLADLGAGEGVWVGGFSGSGAVWTRTMSVVDSDSKGSFSFTDLSATNLAGRVVTTISSGASYVLGGFSFRVLTVLAWPNREASVGTSIADVDKLRCTNLSKGDSGSLNFTYQGLVSNVVDRFTITQPSGIFNASGNIWYNCDLSNAMSNSSGTMQIELEEIV